jgi:hypothetical protein
VAIYIDQIVDYGNEYGGRGRLTGKWCHMATDSDDLEELHRFAESIGLKRDWFQYQSSLPHYDLTPNKRMLAIKHGAVDVGPKEFLLMCKRDDT